MNSNIKLTLMLTIACVLISAIASADTWIGTVKHDGVNAPDGATIQAFNTEDDQLMATAEYISPNTPEYATNQSYLIVIDPTFSGSVYFKVDGIVADQGDQQAGVFNGVDCPDCSDTLHMLNLTTPYANPYDTDNDGFCTQIGIDKDLYPCNSEVDCDDTNQGINPYASEKCGNGIDEDCSGADVSCPKSSSSSSGGGDFCKPDWNCTEWSVCMPNGTKTRECVDLEECGFAEPLTTDECNYVPPAIKEVEDQERTSPTSPAPDVNETGSDLHESEENISEESNDTQTGNDITGQVIGTNLSNFNIWLIAGFLILVLIAGAVALILGMRRRGEKPDYLVK